MVARSTRRQTRTTHRQTINLNHPFSYQDYDELRELGFTNKEIHKLETTNLNKEHLMYQIRYQMASENLMPRQMMRSILTTNNPKQSIRIGGGTKKYKRRTTNASKRRRRH